LFALEIVNSASLFALSAIFLLLLGVLSFALPVIRYYHARSADIILEYFPDKRVFRRKSPKA
jgi:hypothetical protein